MHAFVFMTNPTGSTLCNSPKYNSPKYKYNFTCHVLCFRSAGFVLPWLQPYHIPNHAVRPATPAVW
jgi:hypothetical protein